MSLCCLARGILNRLHRSVAWAAVCSPMEDAVKKALRVALDSDGGGSVIEIGTNERSVPRPTLLYVTRKYRAVFEA